MPDPPEHTSLLLLPPDAINQLQLILPLQQQAIPSSSMNKNPNTIRTGHHLSELPDLPEQLTSLLSPPPIPEQEAANGPLLDLGWVFHPSIQNKKTTLLSIQIYNTIQY